MKLLHPQSLSETLHATAEALFFGKTVRREEVDRVAEWIAGRQGLPGSYSGMFAPTETDYADGIRLFTGERISSGAATGHILGEEACRTLLLLKVKNSDVIQALERANRSMDMILTVSEKHVSYPGFF